jgi:hypothetical protein
MGSFDKSPAELDVVEQDEESDGDDESTSKEGAKHASGPEGSEFAGGGTPATNEDPGPSDPGVEPHGQPEPQEGVVPQSTKPSQMPSEGGGDGGMDMNSLPTMPGSPQFDPGSFSTDPIGQGVNAVAALIAEENPGLDTETVRKVARKVVGRLVVTSATSLSTTMGRSRRAHRSPIPVVAWPSTRSPTCPRSIAHSPRSRTTGGCGRLRPDHCPVSRRHGGGSPR